MVLNVSPNLFRIVGMLLLGMAVIAVLTPQGVQPQAHGQTSAVHVYLTKMKSAPLGAVVRFERSLLMFPPVVTGLNYPRIVVCGPDGKLYVTEGERILRFNQDDSERTVVMDKAGLWPDSIVFAPNGDLYFGTISMRHRESSQGVWRIQGVIGADQFPDPEQVLPPSLFLPPTSDTYYNVRPYAFLTTGPFEGDLLIIDGPNTHDLPGGQVLRAVAPDYSSVIVFIPPQLDPQTQKPFLPFSLALNSEGDVFVTDFTNGKVLRFGPDGTPQGTFAKIGVAYANQIAISSSNTAYVTNYVVHGSSNEGGLAIIKPDGSIEASISVGTRLRGVTVCESPG